jgi:hypothetical protein
MAILAQITNNDEYQNIGFQKKLPKIELNLDP